MTEPKRQHFIRIELPPDATPEEIEGLEQAVVELAETKAEEYDYDINVSGGAWYPPVEDEPSTPLEVALSKLRLVIYARPTTNSPTDTMVLRNALQELSKLGMTRPELVIHLERERAVNEVALRNEHVEDNLLAALQMVTGYADSPYMRIDFQAGTT
jgi:hypothetical protein